MRGRIVRVGLRRRAMRVVVEGRIGEAGDYRRLYPSCSRVTPPLQLQYRLLVPLLLIVLD